MFTDLLASGPGLVATWEALDLAGVVEAWLPRAAVRSRPQRNAVHRHTVDRHLVEVVVAATAHLDGVARPDLLLLAALFHDIGKVAGSHDHSPPARGSPMRPCGGFGLADEDRGSVVRLVREHLTLIEPGHLARSADPATLARSSRPSTGPRRSSSTSSGSPRPTPSPPARRLDGLAPRPV